MCVQNARGGRRDKPARGERGRLQCTKPPIQNCRPLRCGSNPGLPPGQPGVRNPRDPQSQNAGGGGPRSFGAGGEPRRPEGARRGRLPRGATSSGDEVPGRASIRGGASERTPLRRRSVGPTRAPARPPRPHLTGPRRHLAAPSCCAAGLALGLGAPRGRSSSGVGGPGARRGVRAPASTGGRLCTGPRGRPGAASTWAPPGASDSDNKARPEAPPPPQRGPDRRPWRRRRRHTGPKPTRLAAPRRLTLLEFRLRVLLGRHL